MPSVRVKMAPLVKYAVSMVGDNPDPPPSSVEEASGESANASRARAAAAGARRLLPLPRSRRAFNQPTQVGQGKFDRMSRLAVNTAVTG
jgi:hypothetical protein